jgi:hypothetical protein
VLAMKNFLETLRPGMWKDTLPDGTSLFDREAAMAEHLLAQGVVPADVMTGWRQAAADILEMTRHLKLDEVSAADAFTIQSGAVSLTEMRARVWKVVPKVLARGRIRTIDEFYVVKNVLDDSDVPEDERARLEALRFDFEQRAARRRPPRS